MKDPVSQVRLPTVRICARDDGDDADLAGPIAARRFTSAITDLESIAIVRYPTLTLMQRAYELRNNVTFAPKSLKGEFEFGRPSLPAREWATRTAI